MISLSVLKAPPTSDVYEWKAIDNKKTLSVLLSSPYFNSENIIKKTLRTMSVLVDNNTGTTSDYTASGETERETFVGVPKIYRIGRAKL